MFFRHRSVLLCQISKHFFRCQVSSKKSINLLRFERNSGWFSYFIADIYHSTYDFTCSKFLHQLACSVDSCLRIVRVKTFFEFTGSICSQTDSLGRKADICSIKTCSSKRTVFTSSVIIEFSPPMIPAIPTAFSPSQIIST